MSLSNRMSLLGGFKKRSLKFFIVLCKREVEWTHKCVGIWVLWLLSNEAWPPSTRQWVANILRRDDSTPIVTKKISGKNARAWVSAQESRERSLGQTSFTIITKITKTASPKNKLFWSKKRSKNFKKLQKRYYATF